MDEKLKINIFDSLTPEGYKEYTKEEVEWVHKEGAFDGPTVFTDKDLLSPWVNKVQTNHKIAWILECRDIHPFAYDQVVTVEDKFDYIFTFDKELLERGPKYVKSVVASSRVSDDDAGIHDKTKMLSLIASNKTWTRGHKLRHIVAKAIKDRYEVDLWGSAYKPWGDGSTASAAAQAAGKNEPLKDYRFSIAIMNAKYDNYFTETLVDLFRHGTIPIFWGCGNISEYFNTDGILSFETGPELFKILDSLSEEEYNSRYEAVQENFETAKEYMSMGDTFVRNLRRTLSDE